MCLSFLHICPFVLNCVIVTSSAYSFLPLISSCSLSLFRTPEQCPSVVSLLSESYNPHVRCGAAMALGICCAGTGNKVSASSLTPLLFKWEKKHYLAFFAHVGFDVKMSSCLHKPCWTCCS